jgi:hypothetical protein
VTRHVPAPSRAGDLGHGVDQLAGDGCQRGDAAGKGRVAGGGADSQRDGTAEGADDTQGAV